MSTFVPEMPGDTDPFDDEEEYGETFALGEVVEAVQDVQALQNQEIHEQALDIVKSQTPMYAMDAERVVIGSILLNPAASLSAIDEVGLLPEDFHAHRHKQIYIAIVALNDEGKHIDPLNVADELNRMGQLQNIGGGAAISQLEALVPSATQCGSSARMVVEKSKVRAISILSAEALQRARNGHDPDEIASELEAALGKVGATRGTEDFCDIVAGVQAAMKNFPALGGKIKGESTGFFALDSMFRLVPGDLIIVAGRPSMGKTQFVLSMIREKCIIQKVPFLFFSMEMDQEGILMRLISDKAKLDTKRVSMTPWEIAELHGAAGMVADAPFIIDDGVGHGLGTIKARARTAKREHGIKVIVLDYLQLVGRDDANNGNDEVAKISRGLKLLARELNVTFIALSQLNRGVESRNDKRPLMSDLRESGAIEQDADLIAMLYRPEYYLKGETPDNEKNMAEIIVQKNRNGPTGTASLAFTKHVPRFDDYAGSGEEY